MALAAQFSGIQSPELALVLFAAAVTYAVVVYVYRPIRRNVRVSWGDQTKPPLTDSPAQVGTQSGQVGKIRYQGVDWVANKSGASDDSNPGPLCPFDAAVLRHMTLGTVLQDVSDDLRMNVITRLWCPECQRSYGIDVWDIPGHKIGQIRALALGSLRLRSLPRIN